MMPGWKNYDRVIIRDQHWIDRGTVPRETLPWKVIRARRRLINKNAERQSAWVKSRTWKDMLITWKDMLIWDRTTLKLFVGWFLEDPDACGYPTHRGP
eukprot:6987625-Karenia_brevis.AAC.1